MVVSGYFEDVRSLSVAVDGQVSLLVNYVYSLMALLNACSQPHSDVVVGSPALTRRREQNLIPRRLQFIAHNAGLSFASMRFAVASRTGLGTQGTSSAYSARWTKHGFRFTIAHLDRSLLRATPQPGRPRLALVRPCSTRLSSSFVLHSMLDTAVCAARAVYSGPQARKTPDFCGRGDAFSLRHVRPQRHDKARNAACCDIYPRPGPPRRLHMLAAEIHAQPYPYAFTVITCHLLNSAVRRSCEATP